MNVTLFFSFFQNSSGSHLPNLFCHYCFMIIYLVINVPLIITLYFYWHSLRCFKKYSIPNLETQHFGVQIRWKIRSSRLALPLCSRGAPPRKPHFLGLEIQEAYRWPLNLGSQLGSLELAAESPESTPRQHAWLSTLEFVFALGTFNNTVTSCSF